MIPVGSNDYIQVISLFIYFLPHSHVIKSSLCNHVFTIQNLDAQAPELLENGFTDVAILGPPITGNCVDRTILAQYGPFSVLAASAVIGAHKLPLGWDLLLNGNIRLVVLASSQRNPSRNKGFSVWEFVPEKDRKWVIF